MSGWTAMGIGLLCVALAVLVLARTRADLLIGRGPLVLLLPLECVGLLVGALISAVDRSATLAGLVVVAAAVFWCSLSMRAQALVEMAQRQRRIVARRARTIRSRRAGKGIDRR